MTPQTYARLIKLLPKLSALTDAHRLKVLAQIDRVLLADEHGATWCDIADRVMAPTMSGTQLADMVAKVEAAPTVALTDAARQFLAHMRERAAGNDEVYLSARQREWLLQLYHRACVATDQGTPEPPAVTPQAADLAEALDQPSPSERVH